MLGQHSFAMLIQVPEVERDPTVARLFVPCSPSLNDFPTDLNKE